MKGFLQDILAVAGKTLRVFSKDRGEVAIMFLMPLLFSLLLSTAYTSAFAEEGGDGSGVQLSVFVANEDSGPYGEQVVAVLEDMPILDVEMVDSAEEADRLIGEGERMAAIIVPADFSERINEYEPTTVRVIVDPVQQEYASQVTGLVNYAAAPPSIQGEIQYGIRSLLDESGVMEGADPAFRQAVEAQTLGAIMTQLQAMQDDPVISLESEDLSSEESEGPPNFFTLFIPGFTVMFAFFLMGTVAQSLHNEKDNGTFRRLLAAPLARASILGGTMLAFMIVVLLQVLVLFGVGAGAFGMPLGNSILGLVLLSAGLAFAASSLGVLLASVTKSSKQAGAIGLVMGFVLAGLGGALFAFRAYEAEGPLRIVSMLTPHAHAVEGYQRLLVDGLGTVDILPQAGILLLFTVVFLLAAVWRFRWD